MKVTERLAEFVASAQGEAIPAEARLRAKRAILDTVGVMLAGSGEDSARIVAAGVAQGGGRPEGSVAGHSGRAPAAEAALANGVSAHALDYDDVSVSMRGHPSAPLVPALLALGEREGSRGRDVLDAYVVGFEVQARLGRAVGAAHYALGWHATSTLGTLGAAAAAARLLRLDHNGARAALGIAASLASGIQQNFGTMTKPLHAGWAARNGVVAASWAAAGLTADAEALEGPRGLLYAISGGAGGEWSSVVVGLGEEWDILVHGIGVKLYPCCYATHRAIDAALEIRDEVAVRAGEIETIDVKVSPGTLLPLIPRPPKTGLEGKFSLGYCLASAFLDGTVDLASFTDGAVLRPEAQRLLRLVTLAEEGPPADFPIGGRAEVHVRTATGREFTARVDVPRGDPRRPLTQAELAAKFRQCAGIVLAPERVDEALNILQHIEELTDMREIGRVLATDVR